MCMKSLFIGVISSGMFETYMVMVHDKHVSDYISHNANNTLYEAQARKQLENTIHCGKPQTLKDKIDMIFEDDLSKFKHNKKYRFLTEELSRYYHLYVQSVVLIRDSTFFTSLITLTILIVGGLSGYETNISLKCQRMKDRLENHSNRDDDVYLYNHNNSINNNNSDLISDCESSLSSDYLLKLGFISQAIFTLEALVKIFAKGARPFQYFSDKEEGPWNCIDFLIVLIGFLEYTSAGVLFHFFPLVLLRLLRLLRVFRLAKALPRLRSIVEALISAFATVGWICILFTVFNFIVACICIIIFRDNVRTILLSLSLSSSSSSVCACVHIIPPTVMDVILACLLNLLSSIIYVFTHT
jgi:hypothetical protein